MVSVNGRLQRPHILFLVIFFAFIVGLSQDISAITALQTQHSVDVDDTQMYIVMLDAPSVVNRLAQTASPSMNLSAAPASRMQQVAQAQQAVVINEMTTVVKRPLSISQQYTHAINGMAVELTESEAVELAAQPGIHAVVPSQIRMPLTDSGPGWIGSPGLWNGSQTGGIAGTMGEGIVVGIIDTGINLDHPSFAAVGGDGYVHTNPNGAGVYLGKCATQPDITICNDKLIGAYSWPESGDNPEDDWYGHGSNVAGIAAGNVITVPYIAPTIVLTPTMSGVAPHANIIAYDVCNKVEGGCPDEVSIAAVEQAILDGVDVLNFSIGSTVSNPWEDPLSLAFLSAREAGIFVATSAGNNGPTKGSILAPGNSPWITTVGNTTHNGRFDNVLIPISGGILPLPATITGTSITGGHGPAPITHAKGVINSTGNPDDDGTCDASFPPGTWTNDEIVLCRYSGVGRTTKAAYVQAGGAGGVIVQNAWNVASTWGVDRFGIPGINISPADAAVLADWLASGTGHLAEIRGTTRQHDASYADELYNNSARGPAGFMPDVLKPNVSAPGNLIWAAGDTTDSSTPPEFSFFRGTSQASPHVAGSAALLKVLHPDWTPAEIESALMMTAVPVHLYNLSPAGVFDAGSGRVDLTAVSRVGFVLDETVAGFQAVNPIFGQDASQLNLASLSDANCGYTCTWTRELRSTLDVPTIWNIDITQPITAVLSVTPTTFTLQPGEMQTITVTAVADALPLEIWDFGSILFTETTAQAPNAHLPVAANLSNAPPIADAGSNQTVVVNQRVTLDGSNSADNDPSQTLSYGWTQTGGPAVALSDTTVVSPTFTALHTPAVLTFTLIVTDSYGLPSLPSEVVVMMVNDIAVDGLTAANSSPTMLGQSTNLTATLSTGSNISYSWDFGDGESGSGATVSHLYGESGRYTATVTATNSSNSQTAKTIIIITNEVPIADAGDNQTVLVNQLVTLDGSGSMDTDGHLPLSFSWTQIAGTVVELSDETAVSPTFLAPTNQTNLAFTLTVTDSLGLPSLPSTVLVTVKPYIVYLPVMTK